MQTYKFDPNLDLVLELTLDLPVEKVWEAWTTPSHLKAFFVPKPWEVVDCSIDLRPGGVFSSLMRGPDGQEFGGAGCYLEVVKNERLIWTDTLGPGYRPNENPFFTAMILLERDGNKTKYKAYAIHKNAEDRKKHEEMGFKEGWGIVAQQMVDHMKSL